MNTIGFSEIPHLAIHLWRQSYRGNSYSYDKVGRYIANKAVPEFWELALIEVEVYTSVKREMG